MFSLQRLLGKDEKFFDFLEDSAQQVCNNVNALILLMRDPDSANALADFKEARRKGKRVTEDIDEHLCKTFVTPIEREDIESLSDALYKIPKMLEKFSERFILFYEPLQGWDFSQQISILSQATETLLQMVKSLRQNPKLDKIKDQRDRLHELEGDADRLMLDLLCSLYNRKHEILELIIMRDLYELLEKAIDRCRDAGKVAFHIVLKNS
jgi:uncharacterized protein Yka (UPF0111/DUF47 family)